MNIIPQDISYTPDEFFALYVRSTMTHFILDGLPEARVRVRDLAGPVCVVACYAPNAHPPEGPIAVACSTDRAVPKTAQEVGALLDTLPRGTTIAWFRSEAP